METIKELRQKTQLDKTKQKNFVLSKGYLLHRRISIYITKFLLMLFPKINPNFISFLMILISLTGCLLLLSQSFELNVLGIILIYLGFLLDKVDGEIARYRKSITLRGGYLEELYHLIIPSGLLICFLFSALSQNLSPSLILLWIVFLNLLNRINRKTGIVVFVKNKQRILDKEVKFYRGNQFIKKFFNFFVFKVFSIIERFDLVLLSIFLVILFEQIFELSLRIDYLYFYFIFALGYFIRLSFLNYFGKIDQTARRLIKKAY